MVLQSIPSEPCDAESPALEGPPIKTRRAGIFARMLHGTGAGAVSYVLGIASNLLLLPLYLRFWSVAEYGEWMALYSVVNYLVNLDFGVTNAAVSAATIAYARNDWQSFKRIQGTAWAASLVIAGIGGVVVAVLMQFRLDKWLGLTILGQRDSKLVFCGLAISLLANIPGRQLIAVYIAIGEFVTYQWLYNAFALLTFIATAVALRSGAGPVLLAGVGAITTLSTIVIAFWLLNHRGQRMLPHLWDSEWNTARTLAAPTVQTGLAMFASALTVQGPIVILSRMLGGPAVALFTTTRTITNLVRTTVILPRLPLRPELAAASAHPSKDGLRRLFRLAVALDTIIAISLSAVLWASGAWLIRFWSRGHIQPDAMLLHLLLIVVVLEGFLQILTNAGWATNRIRGVSFGLLASAAISLIPAVLLVKRLGPSAIPTGAIVPLIAIMMPVALLSAHSEAHLSLRFVILRLMVPFSAIVAFFAVFPAWFSSLNLTPEWLSAVISCMTICAVVIFAVAAVFLTHDDRQVLQNRIILWRSKKNGSNPPILAAQ